MADRTPYLRASYDAVATTPRPPTPPTTTGLPRRDGLSRCSTAAKKASRSRWRTEAWSRTGATYPSAPTPPDWRPVQLPSTAEGRRRVTHRPPRTGPEPSASRGSVPAMTRPTRRPTPPPTPPSTLEARTPEDVLAAVPVVLGFEPLESVVMLTFGGTETFHARVDLPPPSEVDEGVAQLLEPALLHSVTRVVFVVYADEGHAARIVVSGLRRAFGRAGIDVVEVLRVHGGRWFAPGRPGVPAGGVPYDVADHRFRAQAVVEGIVV